MERIIHPEIAGMTTMFPWPVIAQCVLALNVVSLVISSYICRRIVAVAAFSGAVPMRGVVAIAALATPLAILLALSVWGGGWLFPKRGKQLLAAGLLLSAVACAAVLILLACAGLPPPFSLRAGS